MAISTVPITRPQAALTIWGGGLLAGLLNGVHAIVYYGVKSGVSAPSIFRYIASGLIGSHAARQSGWAGVVLGVALHLSIALGAATVYYFAALKFSLLIWRPFLSGTVLGLGLYVVMYHIVIPLSALPKNPHAAFSIADFISEIFAHVVLVGFPIALLARRSTRVKPLTGQ
ncbi:MAG TPA: hypothetical protein VK798_11765 [Alloacidobacterium sp.]|jgi:hypothetical protein|nr:hypothetical protein [Alloacidobacterium sp.]